MHLEAQTSSGMKFKKKRRVVKSNVKRRGVTS
jgi:hypothetical protein